MSRDLFVNFEVINRLPVDIQTILKRKSSRDPSSRFTSKLFTLLSYVSQYPSMESDIGLAWIDEETFKMNKHNLAGVMGIKLNTLNVNLRDLEFKQQQHNKDGWTRWKKEGFTRSSMGAPQELGLAVEVPTAKQDVSIGRAGKVSLGHMAPPLLDQFYQNAETIWRELNGNVAVSVNSSYFMNRAAERFRQEGQQLQNAIDVLKAIIAPSGSDTTTFDQFVKFLAMFGPEKTVMLKIASLLQCSHKSGQWLLFDTSAQLPAVYGAFDNSEPNCLVVRNNGTVSRVWNLPLVESGTQSYIVDEAGHMYSSWADYFDTHPVSTGLNPYYDIGYAL